MTTEIVEAMHISLRKSIPGTECLKLNMFQINYSVISVGTSADHFYNTHSAAATVALCLISRVN